MEFLFQLSAYDDPALDKEEPQLMEQLLEARSRQAVPKVWAATDKLNAYAAKGPGPEKRMARRRVYGAVLLVLGVILLVPGLTDPQGLLVPLIAGTAGTLLGLSLLLFPKRWEPPKPSLQAQLAATEQLARMRGFDWAGIRVRFDDRGLTMLKGEDTSKLVPYADLTGVFSSDHAWLVGWGDGALLLQKKDLTAGDAARFMPYLQENIAHSATTTDKENTI